MKVTVMRPVEIEVKTIVVTLPVKYGTEDMPQDFPFRRSDDVWMVSIDIDTGKIDGWPSDYGAFDLHMKVTDGGCYGLVNDKGHPITRLEDYVPHGIIPGKYGDYVELKIADDGTITNWPKEPDFSAFFPSEV